MRLLCLGLVLLAGCASGLDTASLAVMGGPLDVEEDVPFDSDTRPTAHLYQARGQAHPGFYTLHDLLFEWAAHGHDLETESYDGDFGHGFALCAIDGFPAATQDGQPRGCFERGGYWAVSVDGEAAQVGMSDIAVHAGGSFSLAWTPL